jgi:hypothetical protein
MNSRTLRLALLALCVGLASAVAAETYILMPKANSARDLAVQKQAVRAQIAQIKEPVDIDPMVAEILARPLFTSTRMPAAMPGADEEIVEEKHPPELQARLAGITLSPDAREALFQREGEKAIPVKVGGEIDGWRVSSIQLDRVVLISEFGKQVIKPTDAVPIGSGEEEEDVPPPRVAQANAPAVPGHVDPVAKSATPPHRRPPGPK